MATELAKRAAMQVVYGGKFSFDNPLPTAESIAEIIDRETHLPELLQALKTIANSDELFGAGISYESNMQTARRIAKVALAQEPEPEKKGNMTLPQSVLCQTDQVRRFSVEYHESHRPCLLSVSVKYGDSCRNGHNTFSITGELFLDYYQQGEKAIRNSAGRLLYLNACGCLHEEIQKHMAEAHPEVVAAIKWHLCSTDGPTHYLNNTMYAAGERDCWGYLNGEQKRTKGGQLMWSAQIPPYEHVVGSDECPPAVLIKYIPVLGEGKARELDKARLAALWPEATDEQLSAPSLKLKEDLEARLPALMEEFKRVVEGFGFKY